MLRTDLLDKLQVIAPALSSVNLVPVLSHIWFRGNEVMAFNDSIAITTPLQTDFKIAVPGKLLLDLLKASRAKNIELRVENNQIIMQAATAKVRLAMLTEEAFVFDMPEFTNNAFKVSKEFLAGIKNCMRSVDTDTSIPDQLGVTLIPTKDKLYMFSTNNATISRSVLRDVSNSIKSRVILSSSFCAQLLSLKEIDKLEINADYALAQAGNTFLFGRTIESPSPLDFASIIKDFTLRGYKEQLVAIPSKLQLILDRAVIMTEASGIEKKPMQISVRERGRMNFLAESDHGRINDSMQIEEQQEEVTITAEPKLIRNGYDAFNEEGAWVVTKFGIIMEKGSDLYLIGVKGD